MRLAFASSAAVLLVVACSTALPDGGERVGVARQALSTCVKQIEAVAPWPPAAWMVLKTDGSLWMTPTNADGDWAPLAVRKVGAFANDVESLADVDGETATYCVVKKDHSLWCWGSNASGNLGDGTVADRAVPLAVLGPGNVLRGNVASATTGDGVTCALTLGGDAYCWGLNNFGQVGSGTISPDPDPYVLQPTRIAGAALEGNVARITAGFDHTCALTKNGQVYCWGRNPYGALGLTPGSPPSPTPTPVAALNALGRVLAVTAGGFFTCGVVAPDATATAGSVYCFGQNLQFEGDRGMLGVSLTEEDRGEPVQLAWLGSDIVKVDAGVGTGCAVHASGALSCWGWNKFGQLGDGTKEDRAPGVTPIGMTSGVSFVSVGKATTCVIKDTSAFCFGSSVYPDGTYPAPFDGGGNYTFDGLPTPKAQEICELPSGGCSKNSDCAGQTPVCQAEACRACRTDSECTDPARPACQPDGACNVCSRNNVSLCGGPTPTCNFDEGVCFGECALDAHCGLPGSGRICESRACRDGCRVDEGPGCPAGLTCVVSEGEQFGACVGPHSDAGDGGADAADAGGGDEGGCAVARGTSNGAPAAAFFGVLGLTLARRRARRRS